MQHPSRLARRKMGIKPKAIKTKNNLHIRRIFLIILSFIVLIFALFYFLSPAGWDTKSKISLVTQNNDGTVAVIILDPQDSSITTIQIPNDTEVNASSNLGIWELGSITRLGLDKKFDGNFLKNTMIKSFNYPIDDWAGSSLSNLTSSNLFGKINAIFDKDLTNLNFFERLNIALFSLSVGDANKYNVDLTKTNNLERVKLVDATLGWQIADTTPTNVQSYFVNSDVSNSNLNVVISNNGAGSDSAKIMGKTLEILGLNIASIKNANENNSLDCNVVGLNKKVVTQIAKIFSCNSKISKSTDNFDIEIDIGSTFKNRF